MALLARAAARVNSWLSLLLLLLLLLSLLLFFIAITHRDCASGKLGPCQHCHRLLTVPVAPIIVINITSGSSSSSSARGRARDRWRLTNWRDCERRIQPELGAASRVPKGSRAPPDGSAGESARRRVPMFCQAAELPTAHRKGPSEY